MKIYSFVAYIARDMIRQKGTKEVLLSDNMKVGIIILAFMEIDRTYSRAILRYDEYAIRVMQSEETPQLFILIQYIYENHGQKNWDTSIDEDEKYTIIENSITSVLPLIKDLKENYNYDDLVTKSKTFNITDNIIPDLLVKIEDKKEKKKILKSLERLEMNFWIYDIKDNKKIYPLLVDFIEDIIVIEFAMETDKTLIRKIIETWDEAVIAQEERDFFNYTAYAKMEFIEKVKYHSIRKYMLSEYERTLNIDKKLLRKFMQHILYYDVSNHKSSPGLDFEKLEDIPHRPFLLERTKIIIGEPDPKFQDKI